MLKDKEKEAGSEDDGSAGLGQPGSTSSSSSLAATTSLSDPSEPDRQYMIKSNNLEFFYEEKETSERVYQYHERLNAIWRVTSIFASFFAVYVFYSTYQQKE